MFLQQDSLYRSRESRSYTGQYVTSGPLRVKAYHSASRAARQHPSIVHAAQTVMHSSPD